MAPPNFALSSNALLPHADNDSADAGSVGAGEGNWRTNATAGDFILESWSEGFMVGALIIMACITVANMRRKVLLHKLILLEQVLAMSHGTFCFMAFNGYGWYLSSTAALLYSSWVIHNVVAWMKVRPFFVDPKSLFKPSTGIWVRNIYLVTLACTVPPIILQIYDNFRFFNNLGDFYIKVRPYEPLFRDPWWVFTCCALFHVIRKCYGTGVFELIKRSPRFGILLIAIALSLIFTALDMVASIHNFIGSTDGINPWWKLSLVFKCLTDTIMLDDFKTELKRLGIKRMQKDELHRQSTALILDDKDEDEEVEFADVLNPTQRRTMSLSPGNSPDGRLRHASVSNLSSAKRGIPKPKTGNGGVRISKLPGLKSFQFGKKKEKADNNVRDVEKQNLEKRDPPEAMGEDDLDFPNQRVYQMRGSLGALDFHTKPAGL